MPGYTNLLAGAEATATLLRGFTTVRDVGGPAFSLKRAIDEGVVVGPRIFSFRCHDHDHEWSRRLPSVVRAARARPAGHRVEWKCSALAMVADSPDEVRVRVREQLMQGATQIKLTAGGGVSSPFSPLDVSTFTEPELRAAVEAAENCGHVCHRYMRSRLRRFNGRSSAGVKCIEHGFLMDEASAEINRRSEAFG